jgi:hypothetical protein
VRAFLITSFAVGFFCGFLVMTVAVSIEPLADRVVGLFQCPGAVTITRDEISGGTMRLRAGSSQTTGTSIVTLTCIFADESIKAVGNDTVAVTAIAGGYAIGFGGGILLLWLYQGLGRLRRRQGE